MDTAAEGQRLGMGLVWGLAALGLSGCQAMSDQAQRFYSGYAADPIDFTEKKSRAAPILATLKEQVAGIDTCYATQYRPGSGKDDFCSGQRNQAMSLLMTESAYICTQHLTQIYGKEASINIATGSIAAISSAVAAISPLARAQSLSALSAISSAERSLINETIYKNLLTTAIATKIEEMRSTGGKALLAKKSLKYDEYRVEDVIGEVIDYHATCAFHRGLELALKEGTNTNPESKRLAAEVKLQSLQGQIDTRATILGLSPAEKKSLLDSKAGAANIGDPVMKSLVEQYIAQAQALLVSAMPAPPSKKAVPDGALQSVDTAGLDVADPLTRLEAAVDAVAKAPAAIAAAVAKDGKLDDKEVPPKYIEKLKAALDIKDSFRTTMYTYWLPTAGGGPIKQAIDKANGAYSTYRAAKALIDQTAVDAPTREAALAVALQKDLLDMKPLLTKLDVCEKQALGRIAAAGNAAQAQVKKARDSADAFAKLETTDPDAKSKPAWATSDVTACTK